MRTAALSEICKILQGGRLRLSGNHFVQAGYPAYGAGGLNGYLSEYEFDRDGIVLSSIGARCGKCFYAKGKWTSLANTQIILPDPGKADTKYLWFQLNDERRWIRSGSAQPFIKPSDVKTHKVVLPSLIEQRRIATILDQAERLRAKRREALKTLETLSSVIFVQLFEKTDKSRKLEPLGGIVSDQKIGLVRSSEEFGKDFPFPYVRMDAITRTGEFDGSKVLRTFASECELEEYALKKGDFLFNTRNSRELVGKTTLFPGGDKVVFNNNIMRIRFKPILLPEYVAAAFQRPEIKSQIENRKTGTTSVFAVYWRELKSVSIRIPPIDLQRVFAALVGEIEELKSIYRAHLSKLDILFASLQHRAFRGEL